MPSGVTIPLSVQAFKGTTLLRSETFTQDIIKIGKLASSHLQLDDESVSRVHAVIEITPAQEVTIVDLGSTKGTFVNGQRVAKTATPLQSGDEVLIGDVRLDIQIGSAQQTGEFQRIAPRISAPPRITTMGNMVTMSQPDIAAAPSPVRVTPPPAPTVTAPPPPSGGEATPILGVATMSNPPPPFAPPPFAAPPRPPAAAAPAAMAAPAALPAHIAEQVEIQDGTYAVEVTAMFEDAVLEVRHFDDPKGGAVTPATKGILAAAAVSLFALLVLFVTSYFQMAAYKERVEAAEKAAGGRVTGAEVPRPRGGAETDVAAVALLVFGLGAAFYGLYRRSSEQQENEFTIGPDPGATFAAPQDGLPVARFPLVRATGDSYELLFTTAMSGDVELGGRKSSLSDLTTAGQARPAGDVPGAFVAAIPPGARYNLRFGENTYNINSVPRPRRYPVPLSIDWSTQSYTGAVFAVVGVFLIMIFSVPPDPKSLSLDAFLNDQRLAKFLVKPEENKEELPDFMKKKDEKNADGGKRAKNETGKMGKKEAPKDPKAYAIKGPRDNNNIQLAKDAAKEAAKDAGVLGIINANRNALAGLIGRDTTAIGRDAMDAMGGLIGTEPGEAFGAGGMGLVGTSAGGGGSGDGTIGTGNLGTIGRGPGGPGGGGYGRSAAKLTNRKATVPDVVPGTAEVKGSLDKELIRRIIRRHLNEVKFCYEKELTRNQNLQGRVMVQFTISPTGAVASSIVQSSTMGNPAVEQCIAGAVRRWEFPRPQGGIVIVTYPFVLKAAAE